jgi:hypothetical protein
MNCRAPLFVAPVVLLIVVAGCGGGGGTNFNNVTVTVSPATAIVPVSDQTTLQAKVTGVSGTPALTWAITELQTNGASGAQCNWLGTTPPAGPCPDGTIQGADASPYTPVTYHAPNTSGTFHIVAQWSTAFNPVIIKNGTAVITVQ